jgi:hypothetical protein
MNNPELHLPTGNVICIVKTMYLISCFCNSIFYSPTGHIVPFKIRVIPLLDYNCMSLISVIPTNKVKIHVASGN